MLDSTRERLGERLRDEDLVLDVGGWADPFARADWVVDVMPYETRGLYEQRGWVEPRDRESERFSEATWVERDICDRDPLPFEDDRFDFAICSHTLEDLRDPVWVCSELARVARAGYIEVPSRLEEQSWGVHGPFVGWSHHHWLIDVSEDSIEFVAKPHAIHGHPEWYFPADFVGRLSEEERVQALWWESSFTFRERSLFEDSEATARYLGEFVARELAARGMPARRDGRRERLRRLLRR